MLEKLFTQAWQQKALWLWLLYPLTWLYHFLIWLNKMCYQLGLKKIYYSPVPVMVIGNISVGGSGKTPLIIALVQYLQQKSIKVAVISRGYGGDDKLMPMMVNPQSTPQQVGDEPCLIVQTTQVPMAVCPNRGEAIALLLKNCADIQLILADDGLQHHALDRDENWIVVDSDRGFGNGQLLPTGFLREPIKRLQQPQTTVIYHQQDWQSLNENALAMLLQYGEIYQLMDKNQKLLLNNQTVIAMTGIGYPKRFFDGLKTLGLQIIEKPLNDHHRFVISDLQNLPDLPIIITEKDAVKIRALLADRQDDFANHIKQTIWVLPVQAILSNQVYQVLDKQLQNFHLMSS